MIMLISPDAPRPVPGRFNDEGREGLPSAGCGAPNHALATPQLDALRFMPCRSKGATGTWWRLHRSLGKAGIALQRPLELPPPPKCRALFRGRKV